MDDFTKKSVPDSTLDSATKSQIAPQAVEKTDLSSLPQEAVMSSARFFAGNKWYIVLLVLGVAIIGVLALFAFRKNPPPKEANIQVTIDAPEDLPSSGDIVVKVNVVNADSARLIGLELEMVYPEGFGYISSTPTAKNLPGTLFSLPDLGSSENTVVLLRLKTQGGVGDTRTIRTRLRYHYTNFNSVFTRETEKKGTFVASGLKLDIQGPGETNNSQLVHYIIKYVNNSDQKLENGRIEATYPKGFVFSVGEPVPVISKNIWNVGSLEPNQGGQIKVTGTFAQATPGETQTFAVMYSVLDSQGLYHTQAATSFNTVIASLPLLVSHALDGQEGALVANPGDTLNYTVRYQNNATFAATAVNIVVSIDSKAVDVNSIQAEGAVISGNTITWNASSFSNLEVVNPGESGNLRFSMQVRNPPVKDTSRQVDVKTTIKIRSQELETYLPGETIQVKVSSIASISAVVSHVSGSLPPRVGQDTLYAITLALRNLTNDINESMVTSFLALPPASFDKNSITPSAEGSKLTLDTSTGKLVWNVGQLRAHTGDFTQPRTVSFTVRLNPSASQVGDEPVLLKNITFTGTDSFTGQAVTLRTNDVTTDDVSGDSGGGLGRVVE